MLLCFRDSDVESNKKNNELQDQANIILKPNLPNINVPEKIIICIDVCYADQKSLFKLADGTTYSPINMIKRILMFFIQLKSVINKNTEFALLLLKNDEVCWLSDFTCNVRDLMYKLNIVIAEHCTTESFDFNKVFEKILQEVVIPEYKEDNYLSPPPYVVRLLVLYGRSNCIPVIPQDNHYSALKNETYLFIDILLIHEDDCETYKCEQIFDALQYLDNGYSYVFEVSRNVTKAHDYIAKLLAHPLQRALQANTKYTFNG